MEHGAIFFGVAASIFGFLAWMFYRDAQRLRTRYSAIVEIESEVAATMRKLEHARRERQLFDSSETQRRAKLNEEYVGALAGC